MGSKTTAISHVREENDILTTLSINLKTHKIDKLLEKCNLPKLIQKFKKSDESYN